MTLSECLSPPSPQWCLLVDMVDMVGIVDMVDMVDLVERVKMVDFCLRCAIWEERVHATARILVFCICTDQYMLSNSNITYT